MPFCWLLLWLHRGTQSQPLAEISWMGELLDLQIPAPVDFIDMTQGLPLSYPFSKKNRGWDAHHKGPMEAQLKKNMTHIETIRSFTRHICQVWEF